MTEYLLQGKFEKVQLHHVRMAFSEEMEQVGRAGLGKIVHLVGLIARIILARLRTGARVLYYPPAGPNMVPFLRDCVILIVVRPFFARTIFHFHAAGLPGLYERLSGPLKLLFRTAYNLPDVAISISEDGRRDAQFLRAKRVALIPNGIPDVASKFTVSQAAMPVILFLGMVCKEKGVEILIDACLVLKRRGLDFRCVIAGRSASDAELECLISKTSEAKDIFEFVGPVMGDQKWKLISSSQIFCFPTYYASESFGLVVVEAMMFGLPVVASNWRALPEIVKDGETGFLVPPHDVEATADRLSKLLTNEPLRKVMGAAARKRFEENYTISTFHSKMENALSSLD